MDGVCPHCGYCKHCGRSNWPPYYTRPYVPYWPGYTYTTGGLQGTTTNIPLQQYQGTVSQKCEH